MKKLVRTALLTRLFVFGGAEVSSSLEFVENSLGADFRTGQKAPKHVVTKYSGFQSPFMLWEPTRLPYLLLAGKTPKYKTVLLFIDSERTDLSRSITTALRSKMCIDGVGCTLVSNPNTTPTLYDINTGGKWIESVN